MEENMQGAYVRDPQKTIHRFHSSTDFGDDHVIRVAGGTFFQDGKIPDKKIPENPKIPQNTSILNNEPPVNRTIMNEKKLFLSLIFQVDCCQCYQEESVPF
jgi:hypothetical protein